MEVAPKKSGPGLVKALVLVSSSGTDVHGPLRAFRRERWDRSRTWFPTFRGVITARTSVHLDGVAAASERTVSAEVPALSVDMASPIASERRLESVFLVRRRPKGVRGVNM